MGVEHIVISAKQVVFGRAAKDVRDIEVCAPAIETLRLDISVVSGIDLKIIASTSCPFVSRLVVNSGLCSRSGRLRKDVLVVASVQIKFSPEVGKHVR